MSDSENDQQECELTELDQNIQKHFWSFKQLLCFTVGVFRIMIR